MTTHSLSNPLRSEHGIALVIVLLLLAVMSALTTGLAMSGQTEIAMSSNEMYYAGARAAAEAGLSRATERLNDVNTLNLLSGADGVVDNANLAAASNNDNGVVPTIGNGPFFLQVGGVNSQYSYTLQIFDDDDPRLYVVALDATQLGQMQEAANTRFTDGNQRLILRATGFGPRNTTVILQRVLQSVATNNITTTTTTTISNPAILVDGPLHMVGNFTVDGELPPPADTPMGNVHANGNITGGSGAEEINGTVSATGTISDDLEGEVATNENAAAINVPEIRAADYRAMADWVLGADGSIKRLDGTVCTASGVNACPDGWTFSSGHWGASGGMPDSATYYVEGSVSIHGTGNNGLTALSVIAEGSIQITGNGTFSPENTAGIQFVTNGDFVSNADANDPLDIDGQIMVREQLKLQGGFEFQGRVMVGNEDSATNVYDATTNPHGRRGANLETSNEINGNMTITYNGSLPGVTTTVTQNINLPTTYTNNVAGWIEQ